MSTRRRPVACVAVALATVTAAVLGVSGCSSGEQAASAVSSSIPSSPIPSSPITTSVVAATPPFIDRVTWVELSTGRSLQVYPTASGRRAQEPTDADTAWAEVVADDPTADTPGMRAQFDCHWTFARLVAPDKPSWNLEPWRPVVTPQQMITDRCNPGGPEE